MKDQRGRGLPARTYLPILIVAAVAFLSVVGYFLRIGLGVTGSALGPIAQQGDANLPLGPAGASNGVGGGTPPQRGESGPPAPVMRLLGELRQRVQRNPRDVAALIGLASLYVDAGKYQGALPYYRRALALEPEAAETRTDYAGALHGAGRDREALAQFDWVLARHPAFADALFEKGVVAQSLGTRAQAAAAFQAFLRAAPQDRRADEARRALASLGA